MFAVERPPLGPPVESAAVQLSSCSQTCKPSRGESCGVITSTVRQRGAGEVLVDRPLRLVWHGDVHEMVEVEQPDRWWQWQELEEPAEPVRVELGRIGDNRRAREQRRVAPGNAHGRPGVGEFPATDAMHGGALCGPIPRPGGIWSDQVRHTNNVIIRDPCAADFDRIRAAGEGRGLEIDNTSDTRILLCRCHARSTTLARGSQGAALCDLGTGSGLQSVRLTALVRSLAQEPRRERASTLRYESDA